MMDVSKFVLIGYLSLFLQTASRSSGVVAECRFEGFNEQFINLDNIRENEYPIGELIRTLSPNANSEIVSVSSGSTGYLQYTLRLDDEDDTWKIDITLARLFEDYLLEDCSTPGTPTCSFQDDIRVECSVGGDAFYVYATIVDVDNQLPVFSQLSYNTNIKIPWPIDIPLNQERITVTDADFLQENADIQVNVNSSKISVRRVQIGSGIPYTYDFFFYLIDEYNQLDADEYIIEITATDSQNTAVATLNLDIELLNTSPPQFSTIYYSVSIDGPLLSGDELFPKDANGADGIIAIDTDSPSSPVEYSIGSSGDQVLLSITNDGRLFLNIDAGSEYFKDKDNQVAVVEIIAKETVGKELESKSVLLVYFTYKEPTTTIAPEVTTSATCEPCNECTTTTEASITTSCPEVPPCSSTPNYEITTFETPECTCPPPSTTIDSCPPTSDPPECNCPTSTQNPITTTTEDSIQTDCPTTTCPTETPTTDCPVTTCAPCSTGPTEEPNTVPTTEFTIITCPTLDPSTDNSITCPTTDCPDTCPTETPTTDCPVTTCAPCSTGPTEEPNPVPTTEFPITTCPTIDCSSTESSITCPTTECPITTCPEIPGTPETTCPTMTCPTCETCPSCEIPGTSPGTECPSTTCPTCVEITSPAADCPVTCPDEEECAGIGGLIAGIVVTSVLFVGSAAAAAILWLQLRRVPTHFKPHFTPEMGHPVHGKEVTLATADLSMTETPLQGGLTQTAVNTNAAPMPENIPNSNLVQGASGDYDFGKLERNEPIRLSQTRNPVMKEVGEVTSVPEPQIPAEIPKPDYPVVGFREDVEIINHDELDYGDDEVEGDERL